MNQDSASHIQTFSVDTTLGAAFLGVVIMSMLMGVVVVQTYMYFRSFEGDPVWLKSIVGGVFVLEVVQAVFSIQLFYFFGVSGYGNPTTVYIMPKSFGVDIVVTILIKFIVGMYYIYRILALTSNKLLAGVALMLHVPWTAIAISIAVRSLIEDSLPQFTKALLWVNFAAFVIWLVTDLYTSVVLIIWLAGRRRATVMSSTIKMLDNVLLWAIQTGLITSFLSMAMLITYKLMPGNFIYMVFYIIQPKLYSNSLLASLNARSLDKNEVVEVAGSDTIAGSYPSTETHSETAP